MIAKILEIRKKCTTRGVDYQAFDAFCQTLRDPIVWVEQRNEKGENLLHLLAVSVELCKEIVKLLVLPQDVVEKLIAAENNDGESPFHYACKYHNVTLFNYIAFSMTNKPSQLVDIALRAVAGRNAFHYFCHAFFNTEMLTFQEKFLQGNVAERYSFQINIHEDFFKLLPRFLQLFHPHVHDLINTRDWEAMTGFMLCCLTTNAKLIAACLDLFTDKNILCEAVTTEVTSLNISPLQFLCAYASYDCVKVVVDKLGDDAAVICKKQNLIEWCVKTQFNRRNEEDLKDYEQLLSYIGELYGKLEESIITIRHSPSLLRKDFEGHGDIAHYLLKKNHVSMQYEIVCECLFFLYSPALSSPTSSPTMFRILPELPTESALRLARNLLNKIFIIAWPDVIVEQVGKLVVNDIKSLHTYVDCCKRRFLDLINQHCERPESIPLALLYKVTHVGANAGLEADEALYISKFKAESNLMQILIQFYQELKAMPEGEEFAQRFLIRIFESNSILRAALQQIPPFNKHLVNTTQLIYVSELKKYLSTERVENAVSSVSN